MSDEPRDARSAPTRVDRGEATASGVSFPSIHTASEGAGEKAEPGPLPPDERVGFAVVGLGRLSVEEILPALSVTKKAKLAALVSGSREKMAVLAKQHGLPDDALYGYDDYDRLARDDRVGVVYIVLPNALHREHVLRAAGAGKHVLCEKPMAMNAAEAREMDAACREANVKLMIAYRCQYEPHHLAFIEAVRGGEIGGGRLGRIRLIEATNGQAQGTPDQWRLKAELAGGGPIPDVGIYCLNSTRAALGEEPVEVEALTKRNEDDPRFRGIEETAAWVMRFPSGVLAVNSTSYATHRVNEMRAQGELGTLTLREAFNYEGQELEVAHAAHGTPVKAKIAVPRKNHFAAEMDHMAECVLTGREPRTGGAEGIQDHVVTEAIYESARTGRAVRLEPVPGIDSTRGPKLEG